MQTVTATLDVFPAIMETPFGRLDAVRVVATDTAGWAFRVAGGSAVVAAEWGIVDVNVERPGVWLWTDAEGATWRAIRGGGCGCSDPMKRYSTDALLAVAVGV